MQTMTPLTWMVCFTGICAWALMTTQRAKSITTRFSIRSISHRWPKLHRNSNHQPVSYTRRHPALLYFACYQVPKLNQRFRSFSDDRLNHKYVRAVLYDHTVAYFRWIFERWWHARHAFRSRRATYLPPVWLSKEEVWIVNPEQVQSKYLKWRLFTIEHCTIMLLLIPYRCSRFKETRFVAMEHDPVRTKRC